MKRQDANAFAPRPRVFTREEIRDQFLNHTVSLLEYWSLPGLNQSIKERLEGLAFSILVTLDGCALNMPGFVVAPAPHPSDRAYCISQGENFYPKAPKAACDIAGTLHEDLPAAVRRYRSGASRLIN